MIAYIIRRLLLIIPTLFGIMVVNFAVVQFTPGGPVEQAIADREGMAVGATVAHHRRRRRGRRQAASDRAVRSNAAEAGDPQPLSRRRRADRRASFDGLDVQYGFDKPPVERFFTMLWDYIRFDFGESSIRAIGVFELISEKMPVSISLGLWMTLLAYGDLDPARHPQGGEGRYALRHLRPPASSSSATRFRDSCSRSC